MRHTTTAVQTTPKNETNLGLKLRSLAQVLAMSRSKIREDLFRFRTCCADPRASK